MYDVAATFPEIQFGVLTRDNFSILDRLALKHDTVPNTLMVRYYLGGHYPTEALHGLDVTDPEWAIRVSEYARGVLNGSISISYQTEKAELTDRDGLVTRLVGSTFESFLEDNATDAFVLFYTAPVSENTSDSEFTQAVTEVYKGGTTSMKFAHINVWWNACERRFPPLLSNTQLVLFPANNRTVAIPYLGELKKVPLLRFFKRRSSYPTNIEVRPLTLDEARAEKAVISQGIERLPDWAVGYATEEIYNLDLVINASTSANGGPSGTATPSATPPIAVTPSGI
jgi:hypothetical protein